MAVRRLVRGTVGWSVLEAVAREIATRYDESVVRIEFLEADNWLSTPCVVNDRWFVKIISPQNALVHAFFTGARNLGVFSSGEEGFFERFDGPVEMAQHELGATRTMTEVGLNAPDPVQAFEVDGHGVLMLEYLPEFRTLDDLPPEDVERLAPELFGALATMHEHDLAHGDLRGENVLVYEGDLYFIDATNVSDDGLASARAYDIACALAALAPIVGARAAVAAGLQHYSPAELLAAREFLDFVNLRPDHDFEAASVKGEIEKAASQ
ncbi:RIO1 family regulatory kinase/ATPase [Halobacteriaceae archaeon GCM10025711]